MYGRYGTPEAGFTYPVPHVPTVHTVRGEGRQGTLPCASGTYSAQVVDTRSPYVQSGGPGAPTYQLSTPRRNAQAAPRIQRAACQAPAHVVVRIGFRANANKPETPDPDQMCAPPYSYHTRPTCVYRCGRTIATVVTLVRHILRARRWQGAPAGRERACRGPPGP